MFEALIKCDAKDNCLNHMTFDKNIEDIVNALEAEGWLRITRDGSQWRCPSCTAGENKNNLQTIRIAINNALEITTTAFETLDKLLAEMNSNP